MAGKTEGQGGVVSAGTSASKKTALIFYLFPDTMGRSLESSWKMR